MISRTVDTDDHIIQVVSIGEATRAEIDTHYDTLRELIGGMRAAGEPVRVLSDQTRATRLSDELNQHIKDQMERTFRAGERIALLMATTDDKLFVRAVLGFADFAVFESRVAAEIWLMEPDLKPPTGR